MLPFFSNAELSIVHVNNFEFLHLLYETVHPYWCIARAENEFKYYQNTNNLTKSFYVFFDKTKTKIHDILYCCHLRNDGTLYCANYFNHINVNAHDNHLFSKSLLNKVREEIIIYEELHGLC